MLYLFQVEEIRSVKVKLQVYENNEWKYVFCYNGASIITTKEHDKAIDVYDDTLNVFRTKFANRVFRAKATRKSPRIDNDERKKGVEYHWGFYQRTGKKYFMLSRVVDKIIDEMCGGCLVSFYEASIRKIRKWENDCK